MGFNEYAYLLPSKTRTGSTVSETISKGVKGAVVTLFVDVIPSGSLGLHINGIDRMSGQTFTILDSASITSSGTTSYSVYPGIAASNNVSKNGVLPFDWRVEVTHTPSDLAAKYSVGASLIE